MPPPKLAVVEDNSTADPRLAFGADVLRVAIADRQALVRAGFRALLESAGGISVVGEAGDCDDALGLARRAAPDVLLIDFDLPGAAGALEVTRLIVADPALAHTRVVLLAAAASDQ